MSADPIDMTAQTDARYHHVINIGSDSHPYHLLVSDRFFREIDVMVQETSGSARCLVIPHIRYHTRVTPPDATNWPALRKAYRPMMTQHTITPRAVLRHHPGKDRRINKRKTYLKRLKRRL